MASKTPPPKRPSAARASSKPTARRQAPASHAGSGQKFLQSLQRFYMALAHLVGGGIRAFSSKKLASEDRRDGAPFFLFLLSIFGGLFAWFLIQEPWARWLHDFSFGMLFGLTAFGLPVVFLAMRFISFAIPQRFGTDLGLGWVSGCSCRWFLVSSTCSPRHPRRKRARRHWR